uniref:Uncharacterized protein n=1 Tax=Cucumis melo TaxID=3656 RepID=A0A9I9DIM7_CUCME
MPWIIEVLQIAFVKDDMCNAPTLSHVIAIHKNKATTKKLKPKQEGCSPSGDRRRRHNAKDE